MNIFFRERLLTWYETHGRHELPWQHPRSPYRVWLSEIMLQQTQVQTVIPYFEKFLDHFPDIYALANASQDQVLTLWAGLGYYSRARNLHKTAQMIVSHHQGQFPNTLAELTSLPGIGRTTACAILSLAFDLPYAILDGNVKRVLSRFFKMAHPNVTELEKILWTLAQDCMSNTQCHQYTQAIMDLGATCCTPKNPLCLECPLHTQCLAYQDGVVSQYPAKKIKKQRPIKTKTFVLFHNNVHEIWLEKRPDKEIWGGLWSLPSFDIQDSDDDPEFIQKTFKIKPFVFQKLPMVKHNFTHYQLILHPIAIELETNMTLITSLDCTQGQWCHLTELHHYGLPTPIRAIIREFSNYSKCI